jgi:hypothetical protein
MTDFEAFKAKKEEQTFQEGLIKVLQEVVAQMEVQNEMLEKIEVHLENLNNGVRGN